MVNNPIHIQNIDIRDTANAYDVHHLQILSYQKESELIDYPNLPPLFESLDKLMCSNDIFIGFYKQDTLVGALSYEVHENSIEIGRLMINPNYFRQGIADKLLSYLEQSSGGGVKQFFVSTAQKNLPAIRLYEKHGYSIVSSRRLDDGLVLVKLEKQPHI